MNPRHIVEVRPGDILVLRRPGGFSQDEVDDIGGALRTQRISVLMCDTDVVFDSIAIDGEPDAVPLVADPSWLDTETRGVLPKSAAALIGTMFGAYCAWAAWKGFQ